MTPQWWRVVGRRPRIGLVAAGVALHGLVVLVSERLSNLFERGHLFPAGLHSASSGHSVTLALLHDQILDHPDARFAVVTVRHGSQVVVGVLLLVQEATGELLAERDVVAAATPEPRVAIFFVVQGLVAGTLGQKSVAAGSGDGVHQAGRRNGVQKRRFLEY